MNHDSADEPRPLRLDEPHSTPPAPHPLELSPAEEPILSFDSPEVVFEESSAPPEDYADLDRVIHRDGKPFIEYSYDRRAVLNEEWSRLELSEGSEAELNFHRARHYDPTVGRWLSDDPVWFADPDGNLNGYPGDSPEDGGSSTLPEKTKGPSSSE